MSAFLFNLHVNDLSIVVTCNVLQYGDNTPIFSCHTNIDYAAHILEQNATSGAGSKRIK